MDYLEVNYKGFINYDLKVYWRFLLNFIREKLVFGILVVNFFCYFYFCLVRKKFLIYSN